MGALPPVFVELKANVSEFTAAMGEARSEILKTEHNGVTSFDKLAGVGKIAFATIATTGLAIGTMSVALADEFEASHQRLQTALKNTGTSYDQFKDQIALATTQQAKYGFSSAETEDALGTMTTALGDPKKALGDLGLAADLAKYKNIDLNTAALAVARAQEGNLKPLKQLGIDMDITSGGAAKLIAAQNKLAVAQETLQQVQSDPKHTHKQLIAAQEKVANAQQKVNDVAAAGKEITEKLSQTIGGQAAASAETLGGKIQALKADQENLYTQIGLKIVPILTKMMDVVTELVGWLQQHGEVVKGLALAIGGPLLVALGAYVIAMIPVIAETLAAAAPFIALGVAIFAIYEAFVYVRDHWEEISSKIKSSISGFVNSATESFDKIKEKFHNIWSGMGDAVHTAFKAVGDIIKGYFNIYINLFNFVISALNKIQIDLPKILGGGHYGLDIKHIPLLAQGGIVNSPTIAMIGEAGPEAVVPLSKMAGMGSGLTVNITVQGSVVQERDLAITVRDNIAQLMRRRGLNPNILGV